MTTSFDIFRVENSGVRWLEAAAGLEEAKSRVRQIAAKAPGEFLVRKSTHRRQDFHKVGWRQFVTIREDAGLSQRNRTKLIHSVQLCGISSQNALRNFFRAILRNCSVAHHFRQNDRQRAPRIPRCN